MDKFIPNHLHLLIKGNIKISLNENECIEWLTNLVKLVRMNVVAGPIAKYVEDYGNEGVTGVVSLATSHSAIHIWDAEEPFSVQFDLYSCSEFTVEEVLEYFKSTLQLYNESYILIDRNLDMKILKQF